MAAAGQPVRNEGNWCMYSITHARKSHAGYHNHAEAEHFQRKEITNEGMEQCWSLRGKRVDGKGRIEESE